MAGVNLQAIYNRLAAAPRYHPMSANTFADWTMEAGDIVTVSRDGTGYASPVGTMTMKWNGKQQIQISSEGSKEREPISRVSAREYARGGGGASGMRGSQELYWEMFSDDGQLHAQIHATAEALTSDYSKKIGDVDGALRGVIRQTAERLTSDYTNKIDNTESHIEQTAEQIRTSVANLDNRLSTQINQTDRSVSMSVGRVKFTSVVHKANKDAFPSPGQAGTLYYADDTGRAYLYIPGTHSYELAQVDEYGNANYIKAGEIAISINESGQTEAKLDATRVLVGKGALTIDDLELPDWMNTTEGLIAEKATIKSLSALEARVGTLETDTLKTSALYSAISNLDTVRVKKLSVASGGNIKFEGNNVIFTDSTAANIVTNLKIEFNSSTNTYTLSKYTQDDGGEWTAVGSFSRATSLSGAWSSSAGRFIVTASPQGETYPVKVSYSSGFTPPGQSEPFNVIRPSASGYDWLRVWQQVGSLDTSTGIRTVKTFAGSSPVESTDITDYNTGYDAVSAPSISFTAVDARATGNPSGTASIANKTGGGTRRTSIGMTMSRSVFSPTGGATERCVNVSYNNTTVGRISVQADYNAGYTAGDSDGYTRGYTVTDGDISISVDSDAHTSRGDRVEIWSSRPGFVNQAWYYFDVTVHGNTKNYAIYMKRA